MEATIKNDYSNDSVNIPALIELHTKLLMSGKKFYSSFKRLPIMRDFLVFTYTTSEDVRKEYWPALIGGLSKDLNNPAASEIWAVLFPPVKEEQQAVNINSADSKEDKEHAHTLSLGGIDDVQ